MRMRKVLVINVAYMRQRFTYLLNGSRPGSLTSASKWQSHECFQAAGRRTMLPADKRSPASAVLAVLAGRAGLPCHWRRWRPGGGASAVSLRQGMRARLRLDMCRHTLPAPGQY